jgi:hypothetical protein
MPASLKSGRSLTFPNEPSSLPLPYHLLAPPAHTAPMGSKPPLPSQVFQHPLAHIQLSSLTSQGPGKGTASLLSIKPVLIYSFNSVYQYFLFCFRHWGSGSPLSQSLCPARQRFFHFSHIVEELPFYLKLFTYLVTKH